MSRLFSSNSSISFQSYLTAIPDTINEEDHEYQDLEIDLSNWTIPKIPIKEIYKTSFLQSSYIYKLVITRAHGH